MARMNPTPPLPPAWGPQDEGHLNLLSVFYYVFGGLGVLGGCFMVAHWWLMNALTTGRLGHASSPPPPELMAFLQVFYVIAGCFILAGTALNIVAAVFLRQRRHRVFTMIVAGLNCLQFPLGTALGVFTFVVLMRESVREGYERRAGELN